MNVAILIPTLGRVDVLPGLLENIRETTPAGKYCVYFVLDSDDRESWEVCRRLSGGAGDVVLVEGDGTYPVKIGIGVQASTEPLIAPLADDIVFHPRWYEAMAARFDDQAVEVVGTLDLTPATVNGKNVTMPIVRRSYVEDPGAAHDEPGVLFHTGYHHNAVERELWQLAKHRGVAVFEPESVIEHKHPSWNSREADDTDRKGNQSNWDADLALYHARERLWRR